MLKMLPLVVATMLSAATVEAAERKAVPKESCFEYCAARAEQRGLRGRQIAGCAARCEKNRAARAISTKR